jgi:hypothetical protein
MSWYQQEHQMGEWQKLIENPQPNMKDILNS